MSRYVEPVRTTVALLALIVGAASALEAQVLIKPPIVSPTLYSGPPPTGFRLSSTTPVSATFTWGATTGAVSYQVLRSTGSGQPWTWLTATPLPASTLTYADVGGIDYRTTYIYRLQVNYSGTNPSGYADLSVALPKPVNPVNFKAKQNGDGTVDLTWFATGAPGYTVYGPGVPGGAAPATGEKYTVTGLANGQTYTWQIATTYQPGNITTPASEFPSASATVLPWTGNYRITLLGFMAMSTTVDATLDSDGKGDEIIPMVFVRLFDQASGNPWGSPTLVTGYVHGDNGGKFRARIRAGTGSNSGGIVNGDKFPAGFLTGTFGTPSTTTFPVKIYEGVLQRDREVIVLYPSLWESDDAPSRWRDTYVSRLPQRTQYAISPTTVTGSKVRQALDLPGISEIRGDNDFKMDSYGLDPTGDRPIGIESVPSPDGQNQGGFFDRIIVLNQRKIEEAIRQAPKYPGLPAGTIGLSFTEGGVIRVTGTPDPTSWNFSGSYALYLRIERL